MHYGGAMKCMPVVMFPNKYFQQLPSRQNRMTSTLSAVYRKWAWCGSGSPLTKLWCWLTRARMIILRSSSSEQVVLFSQHRFVLPALFLNAVHSAERGTHSDALSKRQLETTACIILWVVNKLDMIIRRPVHFTTGVREYSSSELESNNT